jgi:deazaflavin-dependent oxidoreductase (nitroreductase family)
MALRPLPDSPPGASLEAMNGPVQNALRRLTGIMRPLALRSAGRQGSGTAVFRHIGRQSGRAYQTPVVVARHDDEFLIALPYGPRTDWLRNVLAAGSAVIVSGGQSYEVGQPEVIPMAEATARFRPPERRLHRLFHVESALRVRHQPALQSGQ